jgi:hypothetical protein
MHRTLAKALLVALLALGAAAPAAIAGDGARSEGSCSGSGHWELRVDRESSSTLRVRFLVRDVNAGSSWQVFLSDDDHRIWSGSKTANDEGRFRVRTLTRDRGGRDHVEASAVNSSNGDTCEGDVRY